MHTVSITTATELTSAQLSKIKKAVETKYGKEIEYKVQVSKEILGGIVLTIGSRQIDASLKSSLNNVTQSLIQSVNQ